MSHLLNLWFIGLLSNYDYGKEGNINRYGSTTPPLYDLNRVEIPVKIYYGGNDIVIVPKVNKLNN